MNPDLHHDVEKIKDFLGGNYERKIPVQNSAFALDANINWDAARFWAFILYKAESDTRRGSKEEYLAFKAQHENTSHTVINDGIFLEKYWLREVLGVIEFPGTI